MTTQAMLLAYGFNGTVLLAINDNQADASTTFADQSPIARTITTNGNAQYDTAQAPTGMTSSGLFDGSGDYLSVASSSDFAYGTGDYTIECMTRFANTGTMIIWDGRAANNAEGLVIYQTSAQLVAFFNNTNKIVAGSTATGQWYHIALCRSGTSVRFFLNGTQIGSTVTDSTNFPSLPGRIGSGVDNSAQFNGWISNFRITKGLARYTGAFTPPSLPM